MKRKSLLFLLLMTLFVPWAAQAQNTLTVCEGTATNEYIPVYGYYADTDGCNSEFIIPASELSALNGGEISSMTFYLSSPAAAAWGATFQVYLGIVAETTLTENLGPDDFTVVYTGELDGTGSTMNVTFDNTYAYNGGNLLVGTIVTSYGTYKHAYFYGVEATGAAYYSYEGYSGITGGVKDFIPKTTFTYTGGTVVTCFKPKNLAATLTPGNGTIATLTWERHDNGTEDAWVLEYGTAADFTGATQVNVTGGTPTANLTGLTAETTYYARVKPDCDTDGSLWSTPISFTPTNAYSITVNDGTVTNGYVPIYGFYVDNKSYSQFIIPAGDLNDMVYGTISKMVFYGTNTGNNPNWDGAQFEVYMMETRDLTLDALTDWTEMTLVMNAAHLQINDGQMVVTLDDSFQYMGGNLMIGIKQTVSGSYSTCSWQGVTATGASIGGYGTSVSQKNFLPKTTFAYFPGEEPTCYKPTGLTVSNVTNHTAELSWTENGEATEWEVSYMFGDRETTVPADTIPFILTGLEPESEYTVKVRANCGEGDYSDWTSTQSFTTEIACPAPTGLHITDITTNSAVVNWVGEGTFDLRYGTFEASKQRNTLFYDFENGLGDWTTIDGDGDGFTWTLLSDIESVTTYYSSHDWQYEGNDAVFSGSYVNGASVTTDPDNLLVSPMVTLGGSITFYAKGLDGSYPEHFGVCVSTASNTNVSDFVVLQEWDTDTDTEYHEYTVDLSAYIGLGYIAIRDFNVHDQYIVIVDNVTIEEGTSAGEVVWGDPITGVTSPYNLTGLDTDTPYSVQVRANCGTDGYSEWVQVGFRTKGLCDTPNNLTSTDVDATSATLGWSGVQDSYNVKYRPVYYRETYYFDDFTNDDWWSSNSVYYGLVYFTAGDNLAMIGYGTEDAQYLISGELPEFESGSTVEFYQRLYNYQSESTETSFYVGYSTTTDDPDAFTYGGPVSVTSTTLSLYSEVIPSGAKYIAIKSAGGEDFGLLIDNFGIYGPTPEVSEWTTVENVAGNTYTLSGLRAETEYEWQVQGICNDGETEWSAIANFTTTPSCVAPTDLDYEISDGVAVLSWTSEGTLFDIEVNEEVIEEVANNYSLALDPETIYEIRVRTNCGNGDISDWTDYIAFVSDCRGAKDLPYEFGFDIADMGEYYACWFAQSFNTANAVTLAYDPADETNIVFRFSSYSTASDYRQILVSPELNTEAAVAVQFDYKTSNTYAETFQVGYATDDFTSLDDFTFGDAISVNNNTEWATYSETFPAGTKYVAVLYSSNYQYYMYVDNFKFEESTGVTQSTDLVEGWNWFSLGVDMGDPVDALQALEEALDGNGLSIKIGGVATEYDEEWGWFGDLDDIGMEYSQMCMIQTSAACTVVLQGAPVNPADYEITINPGWNWIGFPSAEAISVEVALSGFTAVSGDLIKCGGVMTEYDEDWGWFGDIETLEPGNGYMYYSNSSQTKTLVIQTSMAKSRDAANADKTAEAKQEIKKTMSVKKIMTVGNAQSKAVRIVNPVLKEKTR